MRNKGLKLLMPPPNANFRRTCRRASKANHLAQQIGVGGLIDEQVGGLLDEQQVDNTMSLLSRTAARSN
jgi:hypothetical protein